jgi:branched-chain amino acid transport system ATP-binding protein
MSALLETEDLELAHGAVVVCRDLNLSVGAGEIVTLIGGNGAGKTTTLRALAGVLAPRRGRIRFRGEDITHLPSHERVRRGIALVPEGRRVFPQLSVRENLEMGAFRHRGDAARLRRLIARAYAWFPRLEERAVQRAATLSGGEQQMLALARAMMSEPTLLCLDEPSLGLAPLVVQEIFRTVRAINAEGTSVLLVEQNARYALETATRGYVLQTGAIIASGSCAALGEDARVKEAYLGRGARA